MMMRPLLSRPVLSRLVGKAPVLSTLPSSRPLPTAVRSLSTLPSSRPLSTAMVMSPEEEEAEWEASWMEATEEVYDSSRSFQDSAAGLRQLIKTGLLRHTDLRDRPDRFFKAHRLLARHAVKHGPGFWIRFTVHYNLCFGTVLAVGNPEQVDSMENVQAHGLLGCFALTEKLAGVQSGLIVQTKATYDPGTQTFTLSNVGPTEGAYKNWISQGFVADKAVVLADLSVGGERKGPHAFLMDMRRDGKLEPGVSTGDMGIKTVGNDLDNAWIAYDNVKLPRSALLSRYAEVSPSGDYEQKVAGIKPFEMIGQRLYTGRVAVAQAALSYRAKLFEDTKAYADAKPIPNHVKGGPPSLPLSSIPQLRALFEEAEHRGRQLDAFVGACEAKLSPLLVNGGTPSDDLAHEIATAKVKAVEHSIDLCWRLKQEVGSYALMGDAGFGSMDFLQCCKFAEGDSRVLMLKMARDRLRRFAKDAKAQAPESPAEAAELKLCKSLAKSLGAAKGDKVVEAQIWDAEWRSVYGLAEAVMARTMDQVLADP